MINNYRYLESYIQEQKKEEIALYQNVDRKFKGKDYLKDFEVDTVTLVNLLGSYGNFEVDSNGDGLADGWEIYNSTSPEIKSDSVFKQHSQYVKPNETNSFWGISYNLQFITGHKYFVSTYVKTQKESLNLQIRIYRLSGQQIISTSNYTTNRWVRIGGTLEPDDRSTFILVRALSADFIDADLYVDGVCLYDLTDMGKLPRALQNKYGVTNWVDLTDEQLKNELDYVSSVSTLGWSWDTGKRVEVVENKGINLLPFDDNPINVMCEYQDDSNPLNKIIKLKSNTTYTVYVDRCTKPEDLRFRMGLFDFPISYIPIDQMADKGARIIAINSGKNIFTTEEKEQWGQIGLYYHEYVGGQPYLLKNIMLYEGTDDKEYVPPRQDKLSINTYAFNYFGVSDTITNNQKIKMWEKETVTKSTTFTSTSKNGKGTCILIKQDDRQVFESTISGTNITEGTEPDGVYTVFYQLSTPEVEEIQIENSLSTLNDTDNQFVNYAEIVKEFEGDGLTTVYTHNLNTTNYDVFVNGELAQPIKNTNDIEFNEPPRNGSIIEIKQHTDSNNMYVYAQALENTDIETDLYPISNLEISENIQEVRTTTATYAEIRKEVNKTYSVKIDKDIEKELDINLDTNKTYKLRAITEDGKIHHYCNGRIANKTSDVYNSNRSYTIIFTDKYEE